MHSILMNRIDILTRSRLLIVSTDASLVDVAKLLSGTHDSLVVVCDSDGAMVGVITKTNIVQQIGLSCASIDKTLASDVMTRNVISCRTTDSITDVLTMMEKSNLVQIPVVDENAKPTGVIYAGDALRTLMADEKYEAALLRNYVMGISQ